MSSAVRKYIAPIVLISVGAFFVGFSLINGLLLYFETIPRTTLDITIPILGQTVTAKINNIPDPYAVGATIARAFVLLALGLVGGRVLEIGIVQLRAVRKEKEIAQYRQY